MYIFLSIPPVNTNFVDYTQIVLHALYVSFHLQFKIFKPIGRYFQNCHGRPFSHSSLFLSPGVCSVTGSLIKEPNSWNNLLIDMVETQVALGLSVPPYTPHAISVSLPTWRDNVGYEEGEQRVVDSMISGYPRFFIHLSIKKVSSSFLDPG